MTDKKPVKQYKGSYATLQQLRDKADPEKTPRKYRIKTSLKGWTK